MAVKIQKEFKLSRSNFGGRGWICIILALFSVYLQSSHINDSLKVTIPAFSDNFNWNISLLCIFSTVAAWISVIGVIMLIVTMKLDDSREGQ